MRGAEKCTAVEQSSWFQQIAPIPSDCVCFRLFFDRLSKFGWLDTRWAVSNCAYAGSDGVYRRRCAREVVLATSSLYFFRNSQGSIGSRTYLLSPVVPSAKAEV
jgi:hypothetical protein